MNAQTLKADATEFGVHYKKGGWRLGLLVARNVNVAKAGGDRQSKKTKSITTGGNAPGKVTGQGFAEQAGVSQETVRLHLTAWNLAADNGVIPPSDTLSPGEDCPLPDNGGEWSRYYQMARVPLKPRPKKVAKKAPTPSKRATPGAVVIGRMRDIQAMREAHPDYNDTQIGKALGVTHQQVGRMRWLAQGPPRIREQIAADTLKWSVAQEILQAPLLDPEEQAGLADLFVSGTLTQVGQPRVTVRPWVLVAQRITPAARARFLAGDMEPSEAQGLAEQATTQATKRVGQKAKETSPMVYAENLRRRVDAYQREVESFTDGLTQSEMMIATIQTIDPVTSAHIAKEMNRLRSELWKQYEMLGGWIGGLGGEAEDPAQDGMPRFQVIQGG